MKLVSEVARGRPRGVNDLNGEVEPVAPLPLSSGVSACDRCEVCKVAIGRLGPHTGGLSSLRTGSLRFNLEMRSECSRLKSLPTDASSSPEWHPLSWCGSPPLIQ